MLSLRKLTSSLSAFFRPILRALTMTTQRHEVFLPDLCGGTELQHWYKVVLNYYMHNQDISMSVEEGALPVTQIKRYKVQGGAEHEYLVAKVEPRNVGISPVYVKLERAVEEDPKPRTQVNDPTPPKSTISTSITATSTTLASIVSSSASIVTVSSSSSSQHPAKDQVMFLDGWPVANGKGTDIIGDSQFQKISIFDLLTACVATHENRDLYSLFTHQCYWFANLTTQILLQNDPASTSRSLGQADDAILAAEEADHFTPRRGGTFFGISIHKVKEEVVDVLLDKYCLKKVEFMGKIAGKREAEEVRLVQAVTALAEQELEKAHARIQELEQRLARTSN